jgi:hypothetical protein
MASGVVKSVRRSATRVGRPRSTDSLARLADFAKRLVAVPRSAVVDPPSPPSRKRNAPVRMAVRQKHK